MPLITTAKEKSANSNTPSRVISRSEVKMGQVTQSTARANALKDRLTGKTPSQPVAPRPAGSSARREEMAKLQKYQTPATQPKIQAKTSARAMPTDLASIEPPPSGLAPGQTEMVRPQNTVEAPPASTEATGQQMSPQHVALARKEQQLRKAQREFKAAQDAWKQEQANYIPKQRLTTETLKVLAEAGITPDKLVELQINQSAPPSSEQVLLDKIAELEAKLNGITDPETGTFAQRDKQAYDQTVKQIHADVKLLVDSDPRFGTIKSEGYTNDVVELITSCFDEEGIVLDVEEAATLIEKKSVERLTKQFEKLSKYEWAKAKMGQPAENPAGATPAKPVPHRGNTTLTNAGASQRPLTPRERAVLKVQAAIDAAKGR